jgi:hypothetical protein
MKPPAWSSAGRSEGETTRLCRSSSGIDIRCLARHSRCVATAILSCTQLLTGHPSLNVAAPKIAAMPTVTSSADTCEIRIQVDSGMPRRITIGAMIIPPSRRNASPTNKKPAESVALPGTSHGPSTLFVAVALSKTSSPHQTANRLHQRPTATNGVAKNRRPSASPRIEGIDCRSSPNASPVPNLSTAAL